MRNHRGWSITMCFAAALTGCHLQPRDSDRSVLGRVVVYRNGVAFYERHAVVDDGELTVHVPRDRVDDFLKSLTVVDRATGNRLAVTIPRQEAEGGSYLTMTLMAPEDASSGKEVLLTYVTEAPSWKPSYRVVLDSPGKVTLEAWAIVDNTTSEDWKGVLVGVGASSALAFRYDLWSVRQVDRDLLQGESRFATAPPTGVSPYSAAPSEELVQLDAAELRADVVARPGDIASSAPASKEAPSTDVTGSTIELRKDRAERTPGEHGTVMGKVTDHETGTEIPGVTVLVTTDGTQATATTFTDEFGNYSVAVPPGTYHLAFYYADTVAERSKVKVAAGKTTSVSQKITQYAKGETIVIEGRAPAITRQNLTSSPSVIDGSTLQKLPASRASSDDAEAARREALRPRPIQAGDTKLKAIAEKLKKDRKDVVIEVHGPAGSELQAANRGVAVQNKLIDDGIPASRIRIVPKLGPGEPETVRVIAVAQASQPEPTAPPAGIRGGSDTPVGESHFMADRPMTVRAGSSAMVAMLNADTTGGIVYLYDPISVRGDQRFAFKSVRLDNPTSDTLEPGPVTVYGDGRFIGEGITEPVPPKQAVVVPFALDKQVIVERTGAEEDRIAKLVTVQRGIVTAEIQHRRDTRFAITSRLHEPCTVYLRHRLEPGWSLVDAPSRSTRVGDSQLFQVDVEAGRTVTVTISESTPVQRALELTSEEALGMMKLYIADDLPTPELKSQIAALLATHRAAADLVDKVATLREQIAEYRVRSGELHAQLATLRGVKSGGELTQSLRSRLAEVSDRIQKATIEIVETQEQVMLSRVKFQNQLADLKLSDATRRGAKP